MQVFQVVPPILRDIGNGLEIDIDFLESLKVYLDHFDSFSVACPVRTSNIRGSGLEHCHPVRDLPWGADRLKLIPLPTTYNQPIEFVRQLPAVRAMLQSEIKDSEYLLFSPYSLIGDWPTVALREAVKLRRPYVIEADGVHGDIMRMRSNTGAPWRQFVKKNVLIPLFEHSYRYCLSHSSLAVFQGQDVYDAYASFCSNPHKLNHHIPVHAGDHITERQLQAKLDSLENGAPLKLCYAGRAIDMKGPLDWVETLHQLNLRGVKFQATWLGDGALLPEMRKKVAELGISECVKFPGNISDRETVLDALKDSHIFLFCHTTLESARVLGEALACGCPLVGYLSAYPSDLVEEYGGGLFSKMGDPDALAQNVQALDKDRDKLSALIRQAARSGQDFDRGAALLKRVNLVKQQKTPAMGHLLKESISNPSRG
jgi:glycosyltransferase involved in cell wall biosynthesis